MSQQEYSEVENGRMPIPPEALRSVLMALRALPKDTDEQRQVDFMRPLDDLRTEAELLRDLVESIAARMGTGESARILTAVCRVLLLRQKTILETLQTRISAAPGKAN